MSERTPFAAVAPLTPWIGSEVQGIDFNRPLSDELVADVRALLLERQVLFFPSQHLTPERQSELASRFGEIDTPAQARPGAPRPEIVVFDSRQANGRVPRWHADVTSREAPQSIQVLQVVTAPEVGGDTLFVSGEGAYLTLSEPLKRLVETLRAIHAFTPTRITEFGQGGLPFHWSEHPVVRVHPETGRRSLFVNSRYTHEIVGLRPHESAALLRLLFDHLLLPEHQVRYRWKPGTVAFWDNRNTLHYAVDDYGDALRIVHRVGTAGDRPAGLPSRPPGISS